MSKQSNAGKHSLQKFTDFEEIKTAEDFKKLQETAPEELHNVRIWLQEKITKAIFREPQPNNYEIDMYYNRLERCLDAIGVGKDTTELYKRDRWYVNEMKIKDYIHNTLVAKRYLPTNTDISNATGLSRVTVNKHIKENSLSIYRQEERDKYRMLNSTALNQIYHLAFQNGDVKALKMFIELTKESADSSGVVNNNYIQINNTRIDSVLIEKLPPQTRLQIETLILNNLPPEGHQPPPLTGGGG